MTDGAARTADDVAMLPNCPHPAAWLSWAHDRTQNPPVDRPVYCGRCQRSLTEAEIEAALEAAHNDGDACSG